ncbi:MAG: tetratricopeptide repeat protein [Pirellulaceae bacterium]
MRNSPVLLFALLVVGACVAAPNWAQSAQSPSAEDLLRQAARAAGKGESAKAVEMANRAIELDPTQADAYYLRGRENFRLGNMKQSLADFDKYVAMRPAAASRQWERGITCYYAGEFEKGAKQFELYQTYHDNDVENSVWRYLCVARDEDVQQARKTILPIKDDRRVPMMQVYRLFRGELKPNDVLEACRRDEPDEADLAARLFYANLYLGLYYEAQGESQLAKQHIFAAAANDKPNPRVNRYMWDVARIHAEQMRARDKQ